MKITSVIAASFIIFSGSLFAEEAKEQKTDEDEFKQETLFTSNDDYTSGGYGAVSMTWGKILDKDARFFGGRGGWILNHNIIIGGGGYGLINDMDAPNDELNRELDIGYGGFMIGYTFASHKKFHIHTNILIGGGGISIREKGDDFDEDDKNSKEDKFSVLEPEICVDMNINPWFRIGVGASYRYVKGVSLLDMEDKDFSGASAVLNFKFGSF